MSVLNKKSKSLQVFLQHLLRGGISRKQVKWWLLALVIYLCLPIDLLPDPIPFLGWVDDLTLLYVFLKKLLR